MLSAGFERRDRANPNPDLGLFGSDFGSHPRMTRIRRSPTGAVLIQIPLFNDLRCVAGANPKIDASGLQHSFRGLDTGTL
jgi:hypothetical protein